MTALEHKDRFMPLRLCGCCRIGQATFTGTHGNGRDAPIPAVRRTAIEPPESTQSRP